MINNLAYRKQYKLDKTNKKHFGILGILGIVTPSFLHSQSSKNEDVALFPSIAKGPFSKD